MKSLKINQRKLLMDDYVFNFLKDKFIEFDKTRDEGRFGEYPFISLHRMFFKEIPKGFVIDHINRNKFDFRRDNLRLVTFATNKRNAKPDNKLSKYFGVRYLKERKVFQTSIQLKNNNVHLGSYKNEKDAAFLYDCVILAIEPERSTALNFPIKNYYGIDLFKKIEEGFNRKSIKNKTGYFGVSYYPKLKKKYYATILNSNTNKTQSLGFYTTPEKAYEARIKYIKKHKLFSRRTDKNISWFCKKLNFKLENLRRFVKKIPKNLNKKYSFKDINKKFICDEDVFKFVKNLKIDSSAGYPRIKCHNIPFNKIRLKNGLVADHINGNKYDFRKSNLRLVNQSQNMRNVRWKNPLGYMGVNKTINNTYLCGIRINQFNQEFSAGSFVKLEDAAKCYDILNMIFFPYQTNFNFPNSKYKNLNFLEYLISRIRSKPTNNKTGYRGVTKHTYQNSYNAYFKINGKSKNIGSYKDKITAAKAYDSFARKYSKRKQLLTLNFISFDEWCSIYKLSSNHIKRRANYLTNKFKS